jgi:hypothetical protein
LRDRGPANEFGPGQRDCATHGHHANDQNEPTTPRHRALACLRIRPPLRAVYLSKRECLLLGRCRGEVLALSLRPCCHRLNCASGVLRHTPRRAGDPNSTETSLTWP